MISNAVSRERSNWRRSNPDPSLTLEVDREMVEGSGEVSVVEDAGAAENQEVEHR